MVGDHRARARFTHTDSFVANAKIVLLLRLLPVPAPSAARIVVEPRLMVKCLFMPLCGAWSILFFGVTPRLFRVYDIAGVLQLDHVEQSFYDFQSLVDVRISNLAAASSSGCLYIPVPVSLQAA